MRESIMQHLQQGVEVITDNIVPIAIGALVFLLFVLLRKTLSKYIGKIFVRVFAKRPVLGAGIRTSILDPLSVFFLFLGLYVAISIIGPPPSVMTWVTKIFRVSIILFITWGFYNFTPFATSLIMHAEDKSTRKTNAVAIKFIANVFRIIIIAIAVVIVISELGYNISGLITGLGLGGLTFSLAAQNTASNFFGGFEIVTDKPFDVGDRITTPSVDGIVEDITMRSTRIRTIADTIMVIPNAKLIDEPITNWSRMGKRYVEMTIGLTYSTNSETLQKCIKDIDEMLNSHDGVDKERIVVTFNTFSASSLDIGVVFFTTTTNYDEYLYVRQDVNLKIKEIIENNKAEFAFPSTSVYLENAVPIEKIG